MSLPPLVCNTPPPPDQCEDDKDPEDFDLNYNLSQDDDEDSNEYDYQTFANYNMYETPTSEHIQERNWSAANGNTFESVVTDNVDEENKDGHMTSIINDFSEKLTFDDITVEDLNLEINQEQLNPHNTNPEKSDSDSCDNDFITKAIVIQTDDNTIGDTDTIITQSDNTCTSSLPEDCSPERNIDSKSQTSSHQQVECDNLSSHLNPKSNDTKVNNQSVIELIFEKVDENLENKVHTDDDFSDFDDFQYVSNNNNITTVVENVDNPWVNEIPQTSNFGDFQANFDESIENVSKLVITSELHKVENNIYLQNPENGGDDDQDEFGDFDDFKSCPKQSKENEEDLQLNQQVAALDFYSPENESQILESINTIFASIFEEEILEPETEYIGRLESVLNETWGHVLDADVRQPYMVNWNNSLSQKSLLKALCIDSRNILFGPKWNYNMPKYAVNLSAAPLQPQKPLTSPMSHIETQNPDKSTIKQVDTWTDPFSSNGHESCNNENESATAGRRPTDLEVFDKIVPPKRDKVYPTSLNVQPLRQINLPDTHIFTPSDSETPRSKTIHYDSGPPVILAQPVNNEKTVEGVSPRSSADDVVDKLEDDNEYWEFQDFKSTSETMKSPSDKRQSEKSDIEPQKKCESANDVLKNVMPYQPQLLQPVKVEPIMPTLNWPDPGEVKETFDDFSDFVSNTSWDNDKNNITTVDIHENKSEIKTLDSHIDNNISNKETTFKTENNDDEFETFQSAPSVPQRIDIKLMENNNSETPYQPSTSKTANSDSAFSELDKCNTDVTKTSNDIFIKSATLFTPENYNSNVSSVRDGFVTNSPIHTAESPCILQPLPASSSGTSRHQNNTGQILQPLSLESYSQINWPNPGIDLQDLSRFNPVETLPSLKSDLSTNNHSKVNSPVHIEKSSVRNEVLDDDIWGDFVSSKPKQQLPPPKKQPVFGDEDEWTEFVSSPSVKPQNGLNTISLNVHTNLNMHKSTNFSKLSTKTSQISLDIPTLNYITPKSNNKAYNDKHFQNL